MLALRRQENDLLNGAYPFILNSFPFLVSTPIPIHKPKLKEYSTGVESEDLTGCFCSAHNREQPFLLESKEASSFASARVLDFLKEKKLKYVYLYENLQLESIRKNILSETKGLSGIYMVLNKVTMDYYIGSASTNRIYSRFSNHLVYLKGSKVIKNAVRKYKLPCFAFIVLEIYPKLVNKENNRELLDLEDFYLKSLIPNYNILTEAGNCFGYKHTELDRIKMRAIYSQERRERIGSLNRGSDETIEKIRAKTLERPKRTFSEQALENMKKNSKAVLIYNLDKTVYGKYSSISDAANSLGCSVKTIRRALKTEKKRLKRRYIVELQNYR